MWGKIMKKQKTKYPGVRFRENEKGERHFFIRFRKDKKLVEELAGKSSEGMNAVQAHNMRALFMKNIREGKHPQSMKEQREMDTARIEEEKRKQDQFERDNLSFGQYFEETYFPIVETSKSHKSAKREKQVYEWWIEPVLQEIPLKQISQIHIEKIKKNMLDAGLAVGTIQICLAVVRQAWNMALTQGIVEGEHPTKKVKLPKQDNRRIRFLSHDEADRLLENLKGRSEQLHNLALLSLHCGLRAGEIFNLTWGDVDLERGLITLRNTKNGKTRMAFMTKDIKEMLSGLERKEHDDLVFTDRKGGKIDKISKSFQRAVDDLGLNRGISDARQKVVFHSLRHTFASWLVENGTPLYVVKELMGHSSLQMTERYSHLSPNTLQNAVRAFDEKLDQKKSSQIISLKK
jgi:integrase